jgi:molybdate transport system ATP-binding protein
MSLDIHLTIPRKDFDIRVNLSAQPGEFTAVFGPSGSGKSSLLRAIAGLERDASGTVMMNDVIWQSPETTLPAHQRDVGFVFQDARLFPHLNVYDNVQFGRKRQSTKPLRVSLDQAIDLFGLSNLLDRSIHELSGGERQRVAIARAVATSPSVLLFDEPLAAVDIAHKQDILRYIQTLHRELNIPIIYVSHAIDEVARLSDNLMLLNHGEQIATGRTVELLSEFHLPFSHYEEAASLIETHVLSYDEQYGLSRLGFEGGELLVSCRHLDVDDAVRVRIMARDVSLSLTPPEESSILNQLTAQIESMTTEGEANMLLRLKVGQHILLCRITRLSADKLQLKIGQRIYAQIKAVSLFC